MGRWVGGCLVRFGLSYRDRSRASEIILSATIKLSLSSSPSAAEGALLCRLFSGRPRWHSNTLVVIEVRWESSIRRGMSWNDSQGDVHLTSAYSQSSGSHGDSLCLLRDEWVDGVG